MSVLLVDRLLKSFDELENCISVTSEVLNTKSGIPSDVILRVTEYSKIVSKQRVLALELKKNIEDENWDEVSRFIKLINALSTMIRDDAQAILSTARNSKKELPNMTDLVC